MIAYDESYVAGTQRRLGAMVDFAVAGCGYDPDEFFSRFIACGLAARFGAGDPAIVAGHSGEELALEVLEACGDQVPGMATWAPKPAASPEYWAGWALAFYQWASGKTFPAIIESSSVSHIIDLYNPFHEMDIRQLCDRLDEEFDIAHPYSSLKERRLASGLSQAQLAAISGVPLRTLQQYEQRQKDINRARAEYVTALARALCCSPADLLEYRCNPRVDYALVRF